MITDTDYKKAYDAGYQQGMIDAAMAALKSSGKAKASNPQTSHDAAELVKARGENMRLKLLAAHEKNPTGLTDEEAAIIASVSLASEYATRCSELVRMGVLEDTDDTRQAATGAHRMIRRITPLGVAVLEERRSKNASN